MAAVYGANIPVFYHPVVNSPSQTFYQRSRRYAVWIDEKIKRGNRQLFRTELPLSAMSGLLAYGIFLLGDEKTKVVEQFAELTRSRERLSTYVNRLNHSPLPREHLTSVGKVWIHLKSGESMEKLNAALNELLSKPNQTPLFKQLGLAARDYKNRLQQLLSHQGMLKSLAEIPRVAGIISMTPEAAGRLAASQPKTFVSRLFRQSFFNPAYDTRFFRQLGIELKKSRQLRAIQVGLAMSLSMAVLFTTAHELTTRKLRKLRGTM